MRFIATLAALGAGLFGLTEAQEYAGDFINNTLPSVGQAEIAYWKIADGNLNNLTLINYINHGSDNQRLVGSKVKRAVVVIHGLNRDPGTYQANAQSALAQLNNPDINFDSVAIVAPYFPNGDDKNVGYPWVSGLKPNQGSITNALVWSGSQWSAGGNNQYPYKNVNTSTYAVLDQIIQYFDNSSMFPNMNQIVIAGHSLGGQTVQRYAALGQQLNTRTPISYWVANPDSYVWMSTDRPLPTASCPIYDNYREGYTNFTQYPMTYGQSLVTAGRTAILANFNSKAINYARGTLDLGDDASTCAAETTGANRNERFFNFIKAFPVSCPDPAGNNCDTVDLIPAGHDAGAMMASPAGMARLFTDNFYGNHSRSFDFGYPRIQAGDDPFPNPALNTSSSSFNSNTYAGNMTYWGCWSDQTPQSLTNLTYTSNANTIELCTQTCAAGGNTIAGLEFGTQCFCGNSLGYEATEVIDSSCGTPCPGNSNETCGGSNRISLFSNGVPAIQSAPGTPESVGAFYYTNCYTEASNGVRALSAKSTAGNFMTLEYCASFCSGYQYFGTEYGSQCYCGNSFSAGANVTGDSDCNMLCANNTAEFCGAGNRLTVFQNPSWVASSSTSTSAGTSATSTASASSSTGVSCPASNNTIVTSGGLNFTIECGIDHSGGDLTSLSVSSFQGCIDACSSNSKCVDVSLSGAACYLKSTLGAAVSNSGVFGAKLISTASSSTSAGTSATSATSTTTLSTSTISGSSTGSVTATATSSTISASATASSTPVSCPASNGQTVVSNGLSFLIECGTDHQGGDLTSGYTASFQACIDACAQNPSCVDVSLSGTACYQKSTLGASIANGVWGAKLVISSSSSSSSAASTASSSVTSSSATALSTSTLSTISGSTSLVSTSSSTVTSSSSASTSSTSTSASASATPLACPASNSTTYVSSGVSFLIECGIDHYGGDMSSLSVSSLEGCIAACAALQGCVDVSLSGSACYLKSSVGAAVYNGVMGARVIASSSSVVSTSSVSSSSVVSTSGASSSSAVSTSSVSSSSVAASTSSVSSSSVVSTSSVTSSSTFSTSTTSATISSSSSAAPSSTSFATSTSSVSSSTSSTSSSSASASASAITLTCPASNNTVYTAPQGNSFLIECGIDHNGGDMGMVYVKNFTSCVQTCDSTAGCVDVSLSGTACYMKSNLGTAVSNSGILGAKLIASASTSSSVAAATSSAAS